MMTDDRVKNIIDRTFQQVDSLIEEVQQKKYGSCVKAPEGPGCPVSGGKESERKQTEASAESRSR